MIKKITIFGVITAIVLILVGIFLPIPSKEIDMYSHSNNGYEEYVGGDAYNIQIEASLRGGIISGRTAAKAILVSAGVLELILTLMLYFAVDYIDSKINNIIRETQNTKRSIQTNTLQSEVVQPTTLLNNKWKCNKCGAVNPDTYSFCQNCGNQREDTNRMGENQ